MIKCEMCHKKMAKGKIIFDPAFPVPSDIYFICHDCNDKLKEKQNALSNNRKGTQKTEKENESGIHRQRGSERPAEKRLKAR